MPRLTRAQLKAQAEEGLIHEDSESAPETREASPDTDSARPVLKDITATNLALVESEDHSRAMAQKKPKAKKSTKKNAKKQQQLPVEDERTEVVVIEDQDESDSSEAADTAAESLRNYNSVTQPFPVMDSERPHTPTSAAVKEATRSLSMSPMKRTPMHAKTPRFEPSEHTTPATVDESGHDSFAGTCQKASPFKLPLSQELREEGSDSFVEQIIDRSPSKPIARIEDSVEAIDALEDAIEQVAGELPVLSADQLLSPVKKVTLDSASDRQNVKRKLAPTTIPGRSSSAKSSSSMAPSTKLSPSKSVARTPARSPLRNTSAPQNSIAIEGSAVCPPNKTNKPRPIVTAKPTTTSTTKLAVAAPAQMNMSNSPAKPRANITHKRAPGSILSSVKAPFIPKPSSKPPTTSTFTLPGDAVAAKLKAEREERQKRMEAAEAIKPAKAAPVVKRTVSIEKKAPTAPSYQLPGDAIAAKLKAQREARLERDGAAEAGAKGKSKTFKARPVPAPRTSVVPRENKASTMRMSSVQREESMKRRGSDKENVVPSATNAPAPIPKQRLEVKKIRSSLSGKIPSVAASRRSMNVSNQNVQERKAEPTVTLSKADKEGAARKARAEAAERGRLASREWAEKQKKKLEAGKVKAKRESTLNKELEDVMEVAKLKGQVA